MARSNESSKYSNLANLELGTTNSAGNLIAHGDVTTSGDIAVTGDLSADNITATTDITATGDISGADVEATANATVGGTLGVTGVTTLATAHVTTLTADDFTLTNTSWDDLRFPATNTKKLSGKEPGEEADTGLLLFASASTEGIAALAQMPHAWKEGSSVEAHIHWQKTTSASGNVYWQVEYKQAPIGAVMDSSWTTLFSTTPITSTTDNDTADEHLITDMSAIDMTGYTFSHCILFKISRVGGDALDTYGADARMLEFDIHYEIDSFGTDDEYGQ